MILYHNKVTKNRVLKLKKKHPDDLFESKILSRSKREVLEFNYHLAYFERTFSVVKRT